MLRVKSNPLSTRFVEPGRIAWLAVDPEHSLEYLVNYFTCKLNWRAAIVGPHGSGKSTLLEHLVPRLGQLVQKIATYELPADSSLANSVGSDIPKRGIVWLKLRGRAPSARLLNDQRSAWCHPNSLLVVDGYEQLSMLARARLIFSTGRNSVGLLLTSHRRTFLPTLVKTKVDATLAKQLLDRVLPDEMLIRERIMNESRLGELLEKHDGNLREVFMELYDEVGTGQ